MFSCWMCKAEYMCLCVSWSGTTEENLNKLIQNVKIEHETGYILNWKHLGVPVVSTVSPRMLFSPLALHLFQPPLTNDLFGCDCSFVAWNIFRNREVRVCCVLLQYQSFSINTFDIS